MNLGQHGHGVCLVVAQMHETQEPVGMDRLNQLLSETEEAQLSAGNALALVGSRPPAPPTMRGVLGAKALGLIQHLFKWYEYGLRQYFVAAESRCSALIRGLHGIAAEVRTVASLSHESHLIAQHQQTETAKLAKAIADLTSVVQRLESRLDSAVRQNSLDARVREDLNGTVVSLASRVRALEKSAMRPPGL